MERAYHPRVVLDLCLFAHSIPLELRYLVRIYNAQLSLDNSEIVEAVRLWCEDRHMGALKYGHIDSWNTSNVNDMTALFCGKVTFNDNIESWDVSNVTYV